MSAPYVLLKKLVVDTVSRGDPPSWKVKMPADCSDVLVDDLFPLIELPPETLRDLRNYVGSVARSADGSLIAVSSPEGDAILAIDADTAMPKLSATLRSGCGIAPSGSGFIASSGLGETVGIAGSSAPAQHFELGFDNHLRLLATGV